MNYNLVFTIYGLIFTILLLITLFVKKRKNTIRTKIYTLIIIVLLIYSISEIASFLSLFYFSDIPSIGVNLKNINNVCMFSLITFVVIYYLVIYNNYDSKYDSFRSLFKSEKFLFLLCIVDILASLFYLVTSRNKVIDISNINFISTSFGLTSLIVASIILIICLISAYKKKLVNLFKCFSVIFIVLICLLPFQLVFTHISFIPFFVMLMIFIMYYFIENPDIELLEDVSRLKREIDESSNTKMDFLFNLSYDLVNPISTIVSLSKSLSETQVLDKESSLNDLNNIKYAGNTLLDSINNVLDMSSSQNENINNKEYSVVELVNRLRSATESKIGAKKVLLEVSVSNTVSSKLIGDINKVQKVLLNVLNNAAKYTDIGKIKLDIGATNEKNIQTLNFVILDTGCGIKDEEQEHIYEDGSDDKKGVGLAVSKSYIDSMGGTISFKSVYGAGTTFYISIPQIISGNRLYVDDVAVYDNENENEIIDCSKYKLAIVDDDSLDIKVTLKLLKKYNFKIEVIKSTVDFINKIKCDEKFDLVFLDHKMPVFDGMKTLKALKQLESYELPKFVCFTANSVSGAREFYLSNGFDEYLAKPIDVKELNRIIRKFCKK